MVSLMARLLGYGVRNAKECLGIHWVNIAQKKRRVISRPGEGLGRDHGAAQRAAKEG
jgi:hypothetical protein